MNCHHLQVKSRDNKQAYAMQGYFLSAESGKSELAQKEESFRPAYFIFSRFTGKKSCPYKNRREQAVIRL